MNTFNITESSLGSLPTLVIEAPAGAMIASVALRGATLTSWAIVEEGLPVELVDGYREERELVAQHGVRSGIMTPFTNRLRDGRYSFDGQEYDLHGSSPTDPDLVLHGLLREHDFSVDEIETTTHSGRVRLSSAALDGSIPGYPFVVRVNIEFEFTISGLRVRITGVNAGPSDAPYASGWHPYFRLGDAPIERLELLVPSTVRVLTDDGLIPREGRAAFAVVDDDGTGFRTARPIGQDVIDSCFTGLQGVEGGPFHTLLHDPASGRVLDVWQERGSMHVYTADHLERDPRASIALEPVERLTDAFNRADQRQHIILKSGSSRSFSFGVDYRRSP